MKISNMNAMSKEELRTLIKKITDMLKENKERKEGVNQVIRLMKLKLNTTNTTV